MPYIDLIHSDDCASIWYEANTSLGNVNSLDPDKPTIAMLHPMFLSSTWLAHQMNDPRLRSSFNMIAFDTRTSGASISKFSGSYDSFVQAADLAYCLQYLNLQAVHVFAPETMAANCALRFASLFPDMTLSLTLVNVPPPPDHDKSFDMIDGLLHMYCYAEDIDTFEHAAKELADFLAGTGCEIDLLDDLISFYEQTFPPSRRARVVQNLNILLNQTIVPLSMLESIAVPVLIIQSERSQLYPLEYAEKLVEIFVNAKCSATLYAVKDSSGYLSIRKYSIVNKTFYQFLSRLPPARTNLDSRLPSISERMKSALILLSEFTGNKSLQDRDPMNPLSFSCVTPEVFRSQVETRKRYQEGTSTSFSPLRPNGRPIRRFSERKKDHWFHSELNGISYADPDIYMTLSPSHKASPSTEAHQTEVQNLVPVSGPITLEVTTRDARPRRTNVNSGSSVDKTNIKSSMVKVNPTAGVPLTRMII